MEDDPCLGLGPTANRVVGKTIKFDSYFFRMTNNSELVKVYGASDDLIEFEGYLNEEIGAAEALLAFSNGVLLFIEYDRDHDGIWKFSIAHDPNGLVSIYNLTEDEIDDGEYTEYAWIEGKPHWVVAIDPKEAINGDRLIRHNRHF